MTTTSRKTPLRRLPLLLLSTVALTATGCTNPWTYGPEAPAKLSTSARPAIEPLAKPSTVRAAAPHVLGRGEEVDWVFENAPVKPGVVRVGRGQIGPDGTMVVGPYGTCAVAGMTEAQAARNIEKLLKGQFKNPRVDVKVLPSEGLVWRKSSEVSPASHGAVADAGVRPAVPDPAADRSGSEIAAAHRLHHWRTMQGVYGPDFRSAVAAPNEENPSLLPPYVIGSPDVLLVQSRHALLTHPIQGQHLVRPDGTIGLSIYGSPVVAGMTLDEARMAIAQVINPKLKLPKDVDEKTGKIASYYDADEQLKVILEGLVVDVLAYNSKAYYVITDGGGYGEQVVRLPITGNETVLDAISQINGLSAVSSKHHVWVARRVPGHGGPENMLKVDWIGITQRGAMATNYQIMPGDRLYVKADRWRAADAFVAKVLAPFERILGVTLLGSQTVNSIRSRDVIGGVR